ncbi:phenylalanyl-tRNA synthetase, alpha subunit [Thiovulum sp. ES]|nr:phenylalanyl-tRNA synthetase, alpha subunit [Thiovulum sp. ES]
MDKFFTELENCESLEKLENLRIAVLGKKGELAKGFANMKNLEPSQRKDVAKELNEVKVKFTKQIEEKKEELEKLEVERKMASEKIDMELLNPQLDLGGYHPVVETMNKIIKYFQRMNFSVEEGRMIEDDFHNFEALNLPKHHPARDMQDTFYFADGHLLRTHTSPVQIRTMKDEKPPIRMIAPGTVFRRDFDLTHTPMFHQVEGLVVEDGDKVSFANLKFILQDFLQYMFGEVDVRFRPSFFPFTEPSAEVDISCIFCEGEGCRVCSHTGWLEVLGCGMVDENVFKAVGYENVSGYAFGLGVERFAMLIHKIPDLRSLFEGDLRLLEQFKR